MWSRTAQLTESGGAAESKTYQTDQSVRVRAGGVPAAAPDRHLQRVDDQLGAQMIGDGQAQDRWEGFDASDLLDVGQAAGSAAHCVPRAMAGWLGCFLPPSRAGSSHSVLPAVACP